MSGQPAKANGTNKGITKNRNFNFYLVFDPFLIIGKSLYLCHITAVLKFNFSIFSYFWFFFLDIGQEVFYTNKSDIFIFIY